MTARKSDFLVQYHQSITFLTAQTAEARSWVDQNLPDDRISWGRHGTVVEPRYLIDILDGIHQSGLTWEEL